MAVGAGSNSVRDLTPANATFLAFQRPVSVKSHDSSQLLTNFDPQASQTSNENMRRAHAFHSLMPENIQLPAIQRLINILILEI